MADMHAWERVRPNYYCPVTHKFYSRERYRVYWDMKARAWIPVLRSDLRHSQIEQKRRTWDPEDSPELTHKYRVERCRLIQLGYTGTYAEYQSMHKSLYGMEASLGDVDPRAGTSRWDPRPNRRW